MVNPYDKKVKLSKVKSNSKSNSKAYSKDNKKYFIASRGNKKRYSLSETDAREYGSHGWKITDDPFTKKERENLNVRVKEDKKNSSYYS